MYHPFTDTLLRYEDTELYSIGPSLVDQWLSRSGINCEPLCVHNKTGHGLTLYLNDSKAEYLFHSLKHDV